MAQVRVWRAGDFQYSLGICAHCCSQRQAGGEGWSMLIQSGWKSQLRRLMNSISDASMARARPGAGPGTVDSIEGLPLGSTLEVGSWWHGDMIVSVAEVWIQMESIRSPATQKTSRGETVLGFDIGKILGSTIIPSCLWSIELPWSMGSRQMESMVWKMILAGLVFPWTLPPNHVFCIFFCWTINYLQISSATCFFSTTTFMNME